MTVPDPRPPNMPSNPFPGHSQHDDTDITIRGVTDQQRALLEAFDDYRPGSAPTLRPTIAQLVSVLDPRPFRGPTGRGLISGLDAEVRRLLEDLARYGMVDQAVFIESPSTWQRTHLGATALALDKELRDKGNSKWAVAGSRMGTADDMLKHMTDAEKKNLAVAIKQHQPPQPTRFTTPDPGVSANVYLQSAKLAEHITGLLATVGVDATHDTALYLAGNVLEFLNRT